MKMERIIAVRNNKTIYRDGDKCIKVFNEDYSKADILNEALNQARAEETGLHVPRVLEVTTVNGRWAIVSELIKGKTLSQLMQENQGEIEKYLTIFVDLQLELHARSCPELTRLRDKMICRISQTELDAAVQRSLLDRLESMPAHSSLCHGDFIPSNIIIAQNGTPCILDWAHATQGNASADAARTFLHFLFHNKNELAEKYLSLFCRKSASDETCVRNWLPLVAASQSVKSNAEERKFLLSRVNVVNHP